VPVVAVKVAEVAPAATVTEAGTVSAVLLEVSPTDATAGQAAVIDTVQVVDPLEARLLAPQLTEDKAAATGAAAGAVSEIEAVLATLL
jgi:predicted PhzF superfamily epimerase YddE/YHI9